MHAILLHQDWAQPLISIINSTGKTYPEMVIKSIACFFVIPAHFGGVNKVFS